MNEVMRSMRVFIAWTSTNNTRGCLIVKYNLFLRAMDMPFGIF
jgi:hypothetical protein